MSANRRKYPRVGIRVPVSYTLLDNHGKKGSDFFGLALDVSLGGLLLESFDFIETEYVGICFIDIENMVAQIKCKMVYSRKEDSGMVHTGLMFQGQEIEKTDFVIRIIRANFYRQKSVA
jgi:hypothetical protein